MTSGDEIELDVAPGYRAVGVILMVMNGLLLGLIFFGNLKNGHGAPVPKTMGWFIAPYLVPAVVFLFGVWRVRLSPSESRAIVRRGVWPVVPERRVDLSGERRIAVRTVRGKNGVSVNADLELDWGAQKVALIRNATKAAFADVVRASEALHAPLYFPTPTRADPPQWLREQVEGSASAGQNS